MNESVEAAAPERQAPVDSPSRLIPLTKWNKYFDWPPQGGLRHLRFHQESNGFASAFKTVGSRVLVDPNEFWRIVNEQGAR